MKFLSIGDPVRPGRYTVWTRFQNSVILFSTTRRALFIVAPALGDGPLNAVHPRPAQALQNIEELRLPRPLTAPRYDSQMPRPTAPQRAQLAAILARHLPRFAPPDSLISLWLPTRPPLSTFQTNRDKLFRQALARAARGQLPQAVNAIKGCGIGLTPSGDDFLCGWMLALRLRRQTQTARLIANLARGENPVVNAFLEQAARGRVARALKNLLTTPTPARVKAVCAMGHSSGADLLCGLLFGLNDGLLPLESKR